MKKPPDGNPSSMPSPAPCCGSTPKKTVLLYACSGGANVAEVADRACRELMFAGEGSMYCLAGLGAGIDDMLQVARKADVNLVIDGCPLDCGKRVFEHAGIQGVRTLRVTDLGIDKQKGVRCTPQQVETVLAGARKVLATT